MNKLQINWDAHSRDLLQHLQETMFFFPIKISVKFESQTVKKNRPSHMSDLFLSLCWLTSKLAAKNFARNNVYANLFCCSGLPSTYVVCSSYVFWFGAIKHALFIVIRSTLFLGIIPFTLSLFYMMHGKKCEVTWDNPRKHSLMLYPRKLEKKHINNTYIII